MRVAGLVLAAGAGTRFGRPKALLGLDGRRFVDLAVGHLRDGGADPIFVVVGAIDVGHVDALVVVNDRWPDGIGSSLGVGLAAIAEHGRRTTPVDGVVVTLVDQPRIGAEAVRQMIMAGGSGAHAAIATYDGERLHPVFLHAESWDGVTALAVDDRGARPYLDANADRVVAVPCDSLGDAADVDTPEDLARLG